MNDALRAALSADEETPAGVDVGAIRTRAGHLRRTRYAVAGAAVVTAVAVLVPVAVVQRGNDTTPTAAAAVPELTCPDRVPDGPPARQTTGDLLPPDPVATGLVCTYADTSDRPSAGELAGMTRLTTAEAADLASRLAGAPPFGDQPCSRELSTTLGVLLAGPGWSTTLRVEMYGCGAVSNGTVTKAAFAARSYLRQLEERAHP